jgi:hypothetical protein
VNHDEESVDRLDVSTQNRERILQRERQDYAGHDHHDEDVGRIQSV